MNYEQLKNSILQEAIEGRLVPQDPSDEPAAVLLQRIREEKARLVKEKKIKKDKNESIIYRNADGHWMERFEDKKRPEVCIDEEIPFEIPEGWEWCRIKDIFSMQAGKNISASMIHSNKDNEYLYPCIGGNGIRGYVKVYNHEGDYPIVGRQGALCGNLNMATGKFYATEHAVVTDTFGLSDVQWAYYFLKAMNLNQYATATAQPGLAVSNIMEKLIPLPPLSEQHRIVSRIEEIMPKVEKYGKAQEKLDALNAKLPGDLKNSILQEAIEGRLVPQDPKDEPAAVLLQRIREEKARLVKEKKIKKDKNASIIYRNADGHWMERFEDKKRPEECIDDEIPFEIPETWEWCRTSNIIELLSGRDLSPQQYNDNREGIPYITGASNFTNKELIVNRWTNNPVTISNKGDLLITCKGTIGTMAINNIGDVHIARQVMAIKSHIFLPFVGLYLQTQVPSLIKKSVSMIPGISREDILSSLFPLPPLSEQHRIVAKLESLLPRVARLG